jgi:hypothetical protein
MIDFSHCKKAKKNPRDETRKEVLPGSCNSFQGDKIAKGFPTKPSFLGT